MMAVDRIEPLTPARWPDLERLFGPNGACAGCWCMYWRRRAVHRQPHEDNRLAFKAVVEAGPPPGLLAYLGDQAVGWCQVTPRDDLVMLPRRKFFEPVDDRAPWAISCFFVKAGKRRRGLMSALIEAAKSHARQRGAVMLEAYPWDDSEKKAASTMYTGLASTFARLGFREVARRIPHRPIMRFDLTSRAWVAGSYGVRRCAGRLAITSAGRT